MDIKKYVEQELIEEEEFNTTILEIAKTGSQIFRDNPVDLDYVIILDGYPQRHRKVVENIDGVVYDIILIDKEAVQAQLDFNRTGYIHEGHKLFNYCYPIREPIYGHYNIDWNMLDHEDEYIQYLYKRYARTLKKLKVKTKFTKMFVHYYIPLKIFGNQKVEITDEMRKDIIKLYEGGKQVLPIVDWIENQLAQVEEELDEVSP